MRNLFLFIILVCLYSCNNSQTLYRIQEKGLFGFIDSVGNVVIEPQYKYVGEFKSGYACVISDISITTINGYNKKDSVIRIKYGYIDRYNNCVIDTTNIICFAFQKGMDILPEIYTNHSIDFRTYYNFNLDLVDDRFLFQDKNTLRYGYKDSEGKVVIKPQYLDAKAFSSGRAIVIDSVRSEDFDNNSIGLYNKTGAIDKLGNTSIKHQYAHINNFIEGTSETWAYRINIKDGKMIKEWELIDKDGKVLLPINEYYDFIYNSNSGIFPCRMDGLFTYYTFINNKGIILTDFDHDGLLSVSVDGQNRSEMFEYVTAHVDGFAGVRGYYDGRHAWFFANNKFEINKTPYDSVWYFTEGLAAVKEFNRGRCSDIVENKLTKWGYIDKQFKVKIPYQFSECGPFKGGLAYFKKKGLSCDVEGYINKKGEVVWQTTRSK